MILVMQYLLLSGPIVFIIVTLILGWATPNYSHKEHFISQLSLGKYGKVQKINFIVSGSLISALCIWSSIYSSDSIMKIGWAFGGVVGICLFLTGIWDTDFGLSQRTRAGKIHEIIYTKIAVPATGAAYFILGYGYRHIPAIIFSSWSVAIFSFLIYRFSKKIGITNGVAQRIVVFLAVIWIEILAIFN
jgi:hypothetical membrane protein